MNRLFLIMSAFEPIKGIVTNVEIWYETGYYNINVELDGTLHIGISVTSGILLNEDEYIKQYIYTRLNKEIIKKLQTTPINRLLTIMSTFEPIKGVVTNMQIWYEHRDYRIHIKIDGTLNVGVPVPIEIFLNEDDFIKKYVHTRLNMEITNSKGFIESYV